jgi:Tfp pilus assembly protein FimV
MNCSMARRMLILLWGAGAGLYPLFSFALGLGDLQVESRLNQPLRARIQVADVSDDEWRVLRAHLTSQINQADGLARPGLLESVTFKTVEDENHRRFIEVNSTEVFTEPLFDLSIDVTGASLDVTRNYTVFLDPPGPNDDLPGARGPALASQAAVPAQAASNTTAQGNGSSAPRTEPSLVVHSGRKKAPTAGMSSGGVTAPTAGTSSGGVTASPASTAAAAVKARPANVPQVNASAESYTVTKADTLEKIARRFGGTTAGQRNQFMDWVFQHNPAAFYGDMNRLRAGVRLALPENAVVANTAGLSGAAGSDSPTAKVQLEGELTGLQQELTGLQKMIAQQDAQIASLKQQIATREEQQPASRSGARVSDDQVADEQPDATKSTAALAYTDGAGAMPPEEPTSADHSVEQSSAAQSDPAHINPSSARSQPPVVESRTVTTSSSDQNSADTGASRHGLTGLWARYGLKTSVYYWVAGIGVPAALVVWLVFYIRRRIEEANPRVQLRYEIGPTFERSPEAAEARVGLSETLPMVRPTGSSGAAAKLSVALKRPEPEDTAETEVGHEELPQGPLSALDTWRTQTALLEQDILSETDVLPFVLDTQNQLKVLDEELLSPAELTAESQRVVTGAATEDLPEMSVTAPTERDRAASEEIPSGEPAREPPQGATERLPRMVVEEMAERGAQEQAARQKPADGRAPRDGPLRGAVARDQGAKGNATRSPAETVVENTSDLPAERSATNKEIVKVLESSLDYQPDRVDIQLKLLEIYHHEALDNRENFHSMLRKLSDLKNLSPAQRLHVEMLQRTLFDGDSSFVAEEEM